MEEIQVVHYDTFEYEVRQRQAEYRARADRSRLLQSIRLSHRGMDWSLSVARMLHAAADRLEASATLKRSSAGG